MIQANELRTGNLLLKNNKIVTVNNIFGASGLIQLFEEPFQRIALGVSKIEGINITEELLLKCGFKWNDNLFELDGHDFRMYFKDNEITYNQFSSIKIKCKYLHQLQNLYYVLTNKELEINPPIS